MKRAFLLAAFVPTILLVPSGLEEVFSMARLGSTWQLRPGVSAGAAIAAQPPDQLTTAQAQFPNGSILFSPPSGQDAPKNARGAGRRRPEKVCPKPTSILEAPPSFNSDTAEAWPTILTPIDAKGLTIAAHPTFLIYIPETTARTLEFALVDITKKGEQTVYQMQMPIQRKPGIVRISVPETIPDLEVGKEYEWYVTLACKNEQSDPNDYLIKGKIQRQSMDKAEVTHRSQQITLEEIQQYGKNGLWFDVSAALALLRRTQPQDPAVKSLWVQLLRDVDLEELSDFAVLN